VGVDLLKFAVDLVVAFAFGFALTELVSFIRRFGDGGGSDGPGRWRRWSPRPPRPRPHGGRALRGPERPARGRRTRVGR
jgi:hypothetical protein